jgi:transcriptional regulator with XRE-family HTH domain
MQIMMDKNNNNWKAMSDIALLKVIGEFIKHHRLEQNKTQSQLAEEAGINRSTLSEFEQGRSSNTLTLLQLLRVLNKLYLMDEFKVQQQVSPIQLATLEQKKRKRASKIKEVLIKKPKSAW